MEKANETRRKSRHSTRADPVCRTEKMSSMTMSTVSSALSARRAVAAPVAARAPVVAAPAQRGSLVVVAASKKLSLIHI